MKDKYEFKELDDTRYIREVVYRLVAVNESEDFVYASGTCCSIALNLLVTAKHVIEDFHYRACSSNLKSGLEVPYKIWAIQLTGDIDNPYVIYVIDKVACMEKSDIALLRIKEYIGDTNSFEGRKCIKINAFPPQVGEEVVCYGYHSYDISKTNRKDGVFNIVVDDKNAVSTGTVVEIHELFRDQCRLNFPCFRIDARADGGMSGGPVFNKEGQLCGIICSSLPANENDDEHVTYATTLFPLLLLDNMDEDNPKLLHDLANEGYIGVENLDKLSINRG